MCRGMDHIGASFLLVLIVYIYQITVIDSNHVIYFEIDILWCLLKNLAVEYSFVLYHMVNCLRVVIKALLVGICQM